MEDQIDSQVSITISSLLDQTEFTQQSHSTALVPYISRDIWISRVIRSSNPQGVDASVRELRLTLQPGSSIPKQKKIQNRMVKAVQLNSDSEFEDDAVQLNLDKNQTSQEDYSLNISSSAETADSSEESILDEDHYEVECIMGVRAFKLGRTTLRQYKLKWKNYPSTTWVDEKDLRCSNLLDEFYQKRGSRHVETIAGASNEADSYNLDNWTPATKVMNEIRKWKNSNSHGSTVEVEAFTQLRTNDTIYLLEHNCHFFVMAHYVSTKTIYLSDGDNIYLHNTKVRKEIISIVGTETKIVPVENNIQKAQDFCGSSAAALAITFLQRYKSGRWVSPIPVSRWLIKRITKNFHKYPAISIASRKCISKRALYCKNCHKRFFRSNSLAAHEIWCHHNK